MKPYILIPMGMLNPDDGLGAPYLMRRTYSDVLLEAGFVPVGIPASVTFENFKDLYEHASGILLTGGHDIHPSCYQEIIEGALPPFDSERDIFEINLVKQAAVDKKPLIGICRGAQLIAVALGGTLHQDIAVRIGNEIHSPTTNCYTDILSKEDQLIHLEPASRLAKLLGLTEAQGPCGHHQAIKTLPASLAVAGKSAAGIIEAIEATDPEWYCFGIQSHPETRGGGDFKKLFQYQKNSA